MVNKVLVVDDNEDICTLVSIALKAKGLDVRTAENGSDGIAVFQEYHPDIVLLDHKLPDMDGDEVAKKIKDTGEATKIIWMTGENVSENEVDLSLYNGWLRKPFNLAEMAHFVEQHINK